MLVFFLKLKKATIISLPTLLIILFTFFNIIISKNFFDFGVLIALHGIFFWFLYTPNLLPPLIILILGLFHDIIYLLPLGSTSLIFLFVLVLIKIFKELFLNPSFFEIWISFSVIFSICIFCFWFLISLINFVILPIMPIFFKIYINLIFFPISYIIFYFILTKLKLEKF